MVPVLIPASPILHYQACQVLVLPTPSLSFPHASSTNHKPSTSSQHRQPSNHQTRNSHPQSNTPRRRRSRRTGSRTRRSSRIRPRPCRCTCRRGTMIRCRCRSRRHGHGSRQVGHNHDGKKRDIAGCKRGAGYTWIRGVGTTVGLGADG